MRASHQPETEHTETLKPLDGAVLKVLLDNHAAFKNFLRKGLSDDKEVEDLLQQSWVKALKNSDTINNEAKVVSWFYQILRNGLIDHYRTRAAAHRKHEAVSFDLESSAESALPSLPELEAALCQCLKDLLPTLKPEYAEVIRRADLESEPMASIAANLGIQENNLSVRLHRARQALKTSLTRMCGACTDHACLDCTCHKNPKNHGNHAV